MRTRVFIFVLIVISTLRWSSSANAGNFKQKGVVRITIIDSPGGKLEGGKISLFKNRTTGQDFASQFHLGRFLDQAAENIPFGQYDLVVTQPGFPDSERPVHVLKPDTDVQVCVRTATVHIVDLGPLSMSPIDRRVESFRNRVDDYELADRFENGVASKVPYGTYDIRVTRKYASNVERRVDVFQPDVWVVVSLEFSPISLPEYRAAANIITGRVENIDLASEPLFVTLVGIHSTFRIDDRVSVQGTSGTFSLAGFNPRGDFLLLTYGAKGMLDIRCIQIPAKSSIVVDLRANKRGDGCSQ